MECVHADHDERWMRVAIDQAQRALEHDDVPIGAVVVREGEVIGSGHNERERRQDPTAHAEVIALRAAAAALGSWRVLDATLYVTLEPCAMCAGAVVLARVARVVYGCADPKAGAAGSVLDVLSEPRLNHRPQVTGGVHAADCAALLTDFFAARRAGPALGESPAR
jgi:tRNA(adenine34) deaminase